MKNQSGGIDIAPASRPGGVPTHIVSAPPKGLPLTPNFGTKANLTPLPRSVNPAAPIVAGFKSLFRRLGR